MQFIHVLECTNRMHLHSISCQAENAGLSTIYWPPAPAWPQTVSSQAGLFPHAHISILFINDNIVIIMSIACCNSGQTTHKEINHKCAAFLTEYGMHYPGYIKVS